jgi:hypothetical protein
MIPVDNTQVIEGAGEAVSIGKVTATARNLPLLINLVTDRIYKDKIKAIIREYSTNAWDAHIEAGISEDQIHVYFPTMEDPTLRIRDFGSGLTMEQVRDVYCILGESTKRGSNAFNGQLGLGCKSAFGYGDSFLVTSWNNGTKTIYNIIKGDDEKEGDVLRISQIEDVDQTGIEIAIPINISDIYSLHRKAVDFYKYWEILPTFHNLSEEQLDALNEWRNQKPFLFGNGWEIRPKSNKYGAGESVAVMGQVAYPIDWNMLQSKLSLTPQKRVFSEILRSNDIVLRFPIGNLKFIPNREELEYTETTYKNLEDKVENIFTTIGDSVKEKIANAGSIWGAKRIYLTLFGKNLGDNGETDASENLKILDGDFYRLEEMFEGTLVWNGIVINSPHFSTINRFDYNYPNEIKENGWDPEKPCMVTYKRKKSHVTAMPCELSENNKITPYNRTKVIIVDNRNVAMIRTTARYFLHGNQRTDKVHFLRFANDKQKGLFFKEYNFDTAEFVLISDIINEVKEWQKLTRKGYTRGERAKLQYIDLDSFEIKEEDVSLREMEDGGVFVEMYRNKVLYEHSEDSRNMDYLISNLKTLSKYQDLGIDRIYCLPSIRLEAKWFQKAKNTGSWVNLKGYLRENIDIVVTEEMKRKYHTDSYYHNAHEVITYEAVQMITEGLGGTNTLFNNLYSVIEDREDNCRDLEKAVNYFGFPALDFGKPPVDYIQLTRDIFKVYPLLKHLNIMGYYSVGTEKLKAIVDYIETIDAAKNLLTSEEELV